MKTTRASALAFMAAAMLAAVSCGDSSTDYNGLRNLSLQPASVTLEVGETTQLQVVCSPSNASLSDLTWKSSDESVATVSDGVVTAVGQGSAQAIASAGGLTAMCSVNVESSVELQVNSNWQVSYGGRGLVQGQAIEEAKVTVLNGDSNTYYIDMVPGGYVDQYFSGDLTAYFEAVLAFLQQEVSDGMSLSDLVVSGSSSAYFPVCQHGTWDIYAIGVDSGGTSLTGLYSMASITITEETPTEDYSKWLGTWNMTYNENGSSSSVTSQIGILQYEANYMFEITGFHGITDYTIIADCNSDNSMTIACQYVSDYTDDQNNTYEIDFLGNYYDGGVNYIGNLGETCATGTLSSDADSVSFTAGYSYYGGNSYTFAGMDFFALDTQNVYLLPEKYLEVPVSLTKVSSTTSVQTKSADRVSSERKMPMRHVSGTAPAGIRRASTAR
jgi:hypothetical protein